MGKRNFDFILLRSHHSGGAALTSYLQSNPEIKVYHRNAPQFFTAQIISEFLKNNSLYKLGIFLTESNYSNDFIKYIMNSIDEDIPILELSRDPLERIITLINAQAIWWAYAFCGVSNESPLKHLFHKKTIEWIIKWAIKSPMCDAGVKIGTFFRKRGLKITHVDMSDILPENAFATLSKFCSQFLDNKATFIIPKDKVLSRKNQFINRIIPLYLPSGKNLLPCPVDLIFSRNYKANNIIASFDKNEIGFDIGDFTCPIAFLILGPDITDETRAELRNELYENLDKLRDYCQKISSRAAKAYALYETVALNEDRLSEVLSVNKELKVMFQGWLAMHLDYYVEYDYSYLKYCKGSLDFYKKMFS